MRFHTACSSEWLKCMRVKIPGCATIWIEHLYMAGGGINWYNSCEKLLNSYLLMLNLWPINSAVSFTPMRNR
jgi:hypothetical protein